MKEDVKTLLLWTRNPRPARGACPRSCPRLLAGEWRGGTAPGFDALSAPAPPPPVRSPRLTASVVLQGLLWVGNSH